MIVIDYFYILLVQNISHFIFITFKYNLRFIF